MAKRPLFGVSNYKKNNKKTSALEGTQITILSAFQSVKNHVVKVDNLTHNILYTAESYEHILFA